MSTYQLLLSRVRLVRRKWRIQMLVKGLALFLACSIALLLLGVWGADLFGFKPASVWAMRVIVGGTVLFVALRFLYLPLCRRITDIQIAQFVEERYPQLQDRLISAVEFGSDAVVAPGMLDMLIRDALSKMNRLDFTVFTNRRRLALFGVLGVSALLVLMALLSYGPSFFHYGFDRLYVPWAEASSKWPRLVMVVPGSLEVTKGSDQQIRAQLVGFDTPDVKVLTQPETATTWTSLAMQPEPRGSDFLYLFVDLQSSLRYYVEAAGVRSQTYTIGVIDLPEVEQIDVTYNFPAYTGMSAQTIQDEGDISALKGTKVDLEIRLSQPAGSVRLLFDDESVLDLARAGNMRFSGGMTLERSGSYVVQVEDGRGRRYAGSPEYDIEALEDEPPQISVIKPMRDVRATNVEEVFAELKAEDDIGMGRLELHFSVNGEPERLRTLFGGRPLQSAVRAPHTFFLEEFNLQPGDIVSYYGKALDNNDVTGPSSSSSDIYFIHIRPFDQRYSQSQQGGMPGGGEGDSQEALSKQQKEIISATFKLIRDKSLMDPKEHSDALKTLALVQSRLQAQAQGVVERMQRRGAGEVNEDFSKLSEYLTAAVVEMEKAAVQLGAGKPAEALPDEQKALQQLMRAESLFRDIQVSFADQMSAGGSGSQSNAEDLADLFELELNKLKNQYEMVQRAGQQQRDQKMDEALQRLKELAQRQQQLNEASRMAAMRGGSSSGSSGSDQSQRQLMAEAEKLKRELQRLSRERSSPELNRVGSQLQKAIEEMQKALDQRRQQGGQEANAQGIRALQALDEARQALTRGQEASLSRALEQAAEESKRLLNEQARIQQGVERLTQDKEQADTADFQRRRGDIVNRKTDLAAQLQNLGEGIEALSRTSRKSEREASSRLNDASAVIRDRRLPERILSGNQLIENGYYDFIKGREDYVRAGLEDLSRELEAAKNSIGQTHQGKLEDAVAKTRQLAEGLESMQQRLAGRQGGKQENGNSRSSPGQQDRQQAEGSGKQGDRGQQEGQGQQGMQQANAGGPGGRSQDGRATKGGADSNVRDLTSDANGPPRGIGRPGDESFRQFRREMQERLADAQDLRSLMNSNPTEMRNLAQIMAALQTMTDSGNLNEAEYLARLRAAIDLLRQVERDLDRDLALLTKKEKFFYAEDGEAPGSYRKIVEEYYKALARGKP